MGYIVVIEGTDGSGKQTQTELLTERLKKGGVEVRRQSFPNYDSPSSAPVKMYLGGEFGDSDQSLDAYQASTLFGVDRLCTYNKDLKDFYEQGGVIIFDRYVESNMLHQAGKLRDKTEVDKFCEWLDQLEFGTLKLPRPNKVIFLDVPVEVSTRLAHARAGLKANTAKDIHEQNPEHLVHAYNAGMYMCDKYGWDKINCTVDGNMRSIEDISNEIFAHVYADLIKNQDKSL